MAKNKLILAASINQHAEKVEAEDEICIDITMQEKHITFPTDAKQYRKIHGKLLKLERREGISLDRTYEKESSNSNSAPALPATRKTGERRTMRLKTISGRIMRAVARQMSPDQLEQYKGQSALFGRMLEQKLSDKNKLYNLHEPQVYCMSKGKANQRYEFGTKASIAMTRDSSIIVGALAFENNQYDAHTLPAVIAQMKKLANKTPTVGITDRGYRGKSKVNDTRIVTPKPARKMQPRKRSS